MAQDIILGRTKTGWGRSTAEGDCGHQSCTDSPRRGPGILGWSLGIMFATRIISGKWPWYWFGRVDERLGPRRKGE